MFTMLNPGMVAPTASAYSHGVFIPAGSDMILTSGTLGLQPDGSLPGDFEGQCHLVWANTSKILNQGGFELGDIVKVTTYLPSRDDAAAYRRIRDEYLTHEPASTVVICDLIDPKWLIETEVVAAKPADGRVIAA